MSKCLVTGAGGFIGGHLVARLINDHHDVRAVDLKPFHKWWQIHEQSYNWERVDLKDLWNCQDACRDIEIVYNLAADMGGIGFIESHKSECMLSVLINTNMLRATTSTKVKRYLYTSSACVYHAMRQNDPSATALCEDDAYYNGGAMPEDGYGWEKLFSERMCRHFREDYGIQTRIARLHNIYGPMGTWEGGREKAPAAICRKVAEAKFIGKQQIEVWGDGSSTRSFCWVEDCIEGLIRLAHSECVEPINIGSSELVSINQLIDIVEDVAQYQVVRRYDFNKPQGVKGRNSDNTKILATLDWQPSTPLRNGLERTYHWIEEQIRGREQT